MPLALQVLHDPPLALGEDYVNGDRILLAEAPAAADRLVVLLKAVGRKIGNVVAVLKVQAPGADLGLGDQHPGATFREVDQPAFLDVVTIGSRHLDRIGDQLLEEVALLVQVTPNQRRLAGASHHGGNLLASLPHGALLLCALFAQISGWHGEQHALRNRPNLNQVVDLLQWRQGEPTIIEAKV